MIQQESELQVADNSGVKLVKCIKVLGGSKRRYAGVGDIIICSVKEALPDAKEKKGAVTRVLIVRTRSPIIRKDGSQLRFDENAGILVDKDNEPRGTRLFGIFTRELRERSFTKAVSLAPEVI